MPLPCRAGEGETLKKCTFGACAGAVCARRCAWTVRLQNESQVQPVVTLMTRPQIKRDYPLNLSILLSGGKETNQDSISNGE